MARPERAVENPEATPVEGPPVDPSDAIRSAYRFHRTKRRLHDERKRAARYAGVRFAVTLALLVFVCVVLTLTVWAEIQRLFGL